MLSVLSLILLASLFDHNVYGLNMKGKRFLTDSYMVVNFGMLQLSHQFKTRQLNSYNS